MRQAEEMERMLEETEAYAREISLATQWHSLQRRASRLFWRSDGIEDGSAITVPTLSGMDSTEAREHDFDLVKSHLPALRKALIGLLDSVHVSSDAGDSLRRAANG